VPGITIDHERVITSDDAIHMQEVPKSIVILAAGDRRRVRVDLRQFGSQVTIVELLPRLVPLEDEAVSAELEKSFRKRRLRSTPAPRLPPRA